MEFPQSYRQLLGQVKRQLGSGKRSLAASLLSKLPLTSEIYGPPRGYWPNAAAYNHGAKGFTPIRCTQVHEGEQIPLGYSHTVDPQPHWKFRQAEEALIQTCPEFISWLQGARLVGGQHLAIITPDDRVLLDHSRIFQHYSHSIFYAPKLPPLRELGGRSVLLATPNTHNYAHWLHDCLPHYGFVLEFAGLDQGEVDQFIIGKRSRFVEGSLDVLGIPEAKRVYVDQDFHVRCETLIQPMMNIFGIPSPWEIQFFHKYLLDPILAEADPNRERRTRIYISRENASYRRISNRDQVEAILSDYGFTKVLLETLSFREQVLLFYDAEIICGAHGAGLANIVFCQPNAHMIELLPVDKVTLAFCTTCAQVGLNHHYLISKGERPDDEGNYLKHWNTQSEIECDLDHLHQTVEQILEASGVLS